MTKPTIALVQGDATGIGPELMAKLLADASVGDDVNLLVISDRQVFQSGCDVANIQHPYDPVASIDEVDFARKPWQLIDLTAPTAESYQPGRVSQAAGTAVLKGFGLALDLAKVGRIDGLCFMPFNKEAMHLAGLDAEDELRFAKNRLGCPGPVSEFNVVDGMWNARVTSHVALRDVAGLLSVERIVEAVRLAHRTLIAAGIKRPRIAVAALNPHAGDGGNMGREEIDIIAPAIDQARTFQIQVDGPYPSDTLYLKIRDRQYDCAVSMYHDQGQIAIKLMGFDRGVSVHAGLPIPMATPAHGTAFDIVSQNIANVEPSRRALAMVVAMATNR